MSTRRLRLSTPAARTAASGLARLRSASSVVVVTGVRSVLASSSMTLSVGNVSGCAMAKSMASKPSSWAFAMTQRSSSQKFSVQMKVSTPNLMCRVEPLLPTHG